jgi:hypothetical protein
MALNMSDKSVRQYTDIEIIQQVLEGKAIRSILFIVFV